MERVETELQLHKSTLEEKQAALSKLESKKLVSRSDYLNLLTEGNLFKVQLEAKRERLVQHCDEHRALQRAFLQCAKECSNSKKIVFALHEKLINIKQSHREALREAARREKEAAAARDQVMKQELFKLTQDAKATVCATEAESSRLQSLQDCFREVCRQFNDEDDVLPSAQQAFSAALASLTGEVQARLGALTLRPKPMKMMGERIETEKSRAKSGADNAKLLLERLEKNCDAGGETELKALRDEIRNLANSLPALVVVGNEMYNAQTNFEL